LLCWFKAVPEAFVPIITANISGVPIDFLFARLALPTIPDELELKDDNLLKNLDERCVRSLGGMAYVDHLSYGYVTAVLLIRI
jgi:poly(A) polymerase